jgi:hypothetical protein
LGQQDKRILLLLDGHATHHHGPNLDLCRDNMIDVCFLPPHTSHILQPLDVGIFNSYKAAYRRDSRDPALHDFNTTYVSEATRLRLRMLGRSLAAQMLALSIRAIHAALNIRAIRQSFFHTGIYPLSFHRFIFHCHGVRDIPPDVRTEAIAAVNAENEADARRLATKRRRLITDDILLVDSNLEV